MKIHEIKIYQEFDAPAEVVFDALSDHSNFGKIMGMSMIRVKDSPQAGNINGVGSIRLIKAGPISFEETIMKADKPGVIEYKITKGTPLKHHYGTMKFKNLPAGRSSLDYVITIGTPIPFLGIIIKANLQKGLERGLAGYARRLKK